MRRRRRTATPAAPCCSMSLGSPLWASSPCSWCCRLPGVVGECSVGEKLASAALRKAELCTMWYFQPGARIFFFYRNQVPVGPCARNVPCSSSFG
jgi:hypothetical protein